jgi:hypothetical protein
VDVGDLDVSENPLFARPIVRDGDRYVVAPRALLMALCNALIRLAKQRRRHGTASRKLRGAGLLEHRGVKEPCTTANKNALPRFSAGCRQTVVKGT